MRTEAPVTLVVAGAGSGKSSLLVQAAGDVTRPVAWLGVDEGDADPVRFWQGVVAAVAHVVPGFGQEVVDLLVLDGQVTPDVLETFLDAVVRLESPVHLVVDDLHRAGDEVAPTLRWVLERCSDDLRWTIGSRAEPPIGLDRLVAAGRLQVLRGPDLRFSRAEAAALAVSVGADLAEEELDLLVDLTEGWAVGLQLVAVALSGTEGRDDVLDRLRASAPAAVGYLWSEVLDVQPPNVQRFLLDTCIVDELTPELAAVLCPGSPVSLPWIAAANLPVSVRSGGFAPTYQYHQLVADALRRRLHRTDSAHEAVLHRRAAEWFRARGDVALAFRHGWRSGDRVETMRSFHARAIDAYHTGELALLASDGVTLLDDDVREAPGPATAFALALVLGGRAQDARRLLDRIRSLGSERMTVQDEFELLSATAQVTALLGKMDEAVTRYESALQLADRHGLTGEWRDLASSMAVRPHAWTGDIETADRIAATVDLSDVSGGMRVEHRSALALADLFAGRLTSCIAHARAGLAEVRARTSAVSGQEPLAAVLGIALLERNQVDEAEPLLRLASEPGNPRFPVRILGVVGFARVLQARGEAQAAIVVLEGVRGLLGGPTTSNRVTSHALARLGRILADLGEVATARRIADELQPTPDRSLLVARCEYLLGNDLAALAVLDSLGPTLRGGPAVEAAVLRVAVAARAGDGTDDVADRAIQLAEPEGFLFALAECGPAALEAIRDRARWRPATPFVEHMLQLPAHVLVTRPEARHRPDVLTERERVVLRYLATSLTYPEIAEALYVSRNTVKTHARNVIRKLHATSRRDAVARARLLHYL
jgi:LuxR family maltose regulon positive regulatory protein